MFKAEIMEVDEKVICSGQAGHLFEDHVKIFKLKDDLDSNDDSGIGSPGSAIPGELSATSSTAPSAAAVTTMVFQISEMYTKVAVHFSDGTLRPVKFTSKNKNNPTLMCLGFLGNQVFVYGESVKEYADKFKKNERIAWNTKIWCISQLLMLQNCKKLLKWNEGGLECGAELLVGIFFKNLKKRVESKLKLSSSRVVFCVPQWYGAVQRQRLKGAAFVAGFHEAFVVNEATLVAIIHLKLIDSLPRTRSTHFLVLDENSGNIDLALYTRKSSGALTMVASVGNLQPSSNLIQKWCRKCFEKYKRKINPTSLLLKRRYLKKLLKELEQELEQQGMKQLPQDIEVVLFCGDQRWKVMLENVVKHVPVNMYTHLGEHPLKLLGDTASPKLSLPELIGTTGTDLLAFPLCRSDLLCTKTYVKLTENHEEAKDGTPIKAVLRYPSSKTNIYQQNGLDNYFRIGMLEISRIKMFQYHEVQVNLLMAKDGCLQLDSIYGCNFKGVQIYRLHCPSDYNWIPGYATLTQLPRIKMTAHEIQNWNHAYPSILEGACEQVKKLGNSLSFDIWVEVSRGDASHQLLKYQSRVDYILERINLSFLPLAEVTLEDTRRWTTQLEIIKRTFKFV